MLKVDNQTSLDAILNASDAFVKEANETTFLLRRTLGEMNNNNNSMTGLATFTPRTVPPFVEAMSDFPWYRLYPVTFGFIVMLHAAFLWHWNRRTSIADQSATYHSIVAKKQFHRLVTACLSHPSPPSSSSARIRSHSTTAIAFGNDESETGGGRAMMSAPSSSQWHALRHQAVSRIQVAFQPLLQQGDLAGLPLLMYNSHLIWTCRALEPYYDSWRYTALLVTLAFLSFGLELRIIHAIVQATHSRSLRILADHHPFYSGVARARRRMLLHRKLVSPTALTSALLVLWRHHFPLLSVPVLPILPKMIFWILDGSPFLSYWLALTILSLLSWRTHPFTSIVSGFLVGTITAWFTQDGPFWLWWVTLCAAVLCALSLRLPCVDFVAWDSDGNVRTPGVDLEEDVIRQQEHDEQIDDDDADDLDGGIDDDMNSITVGNDDIEMNAYNNRRHED